MPFPARLKRVLGKSDEPQAEPPSPDRQHALFPEPEKHTSPPDAVPALAAESSSTVVSPPSTEGSCASRASSTSKPSVKESDDSHALELRDLWSNAYAQLQEEEPKLVAAYEQSLIDSQTPLPSSESEATGLERQQMLQELVQRRLKDLQNSRLKVVVGGREFAVRDQARRAVHAILSVKDMIDFAVSMDPHASLAWAGVLVFLNPVANAITQDSDAAEGFEYISHLLVRFKVIEATHIKIHPRATTATHLETREELHVALRARIVKLYAQILRYQIRLAKHYAHSTFFRSLRDLGVADDWKEMLGSIIDMEQGIKGDLQVLTGHTIQEIDGKVAELRHLMDQTLKLASETRDEVKASKQLQLLESLPLAAGALFGSFEDQHKALCLENTQKHTLSRLATWCGDPEGKPILWLKGMAGTGKTTISRTFASACRDGVALTNGSHLPETVCLGASFFFDRTKPDRNNAGKLFTTVSRALADVLPGIRDYICDAVAKNPNIGNESLASQWKHLVFQPLQAWERQQDLLPVILFFVFDAMDECQDGENLTLIFQLLSNVRELKIIRLRILLTSRPEVHVRHGIHQHLRDIAQEEVLDKVSTAEVGKDDITLYIEHELADISRKHSCAGDWPHPVDVRTLVHKADGLFIYAATACRFLGGARLPSLVNKRMRMIFDGQVAGNSPQGSLDEIYTHILQFSLGEDLLEEEKQELTDLFKQCVGTIVTAFEPLGKAALSDLLGVPKFKVDETIQDLHSLLTVPEDDQAPVRLLHLSFRDFLLDDQRCIDKAFLVDECKQHGYLLQRCLEVMSNGLRRDICSLSKPGTLVSDVEPLRIARCIPAQLYYACVYWVDHLRGSQNQPGDDQEVHNFLKAHVLYWLEAMALLGRSVDSVRKITQLREYLLSLPVNADSELRELVHDAYRFSLNFRTVIATAPLQTYSSALMFAPEMSVIRRLFASHIPSWLDQRPINTQWDSLLQSFVGHSGTATVVAFSLDGRGLVSGANDNTVRVWDVATGELRHTWECDKAPKCAVFSPNGRTVAAGFNDGSFLYVWDTESGALLQALDLKVDGRGRVMEVEFSPDSKTLAMISWEGDVRVWDVLTGSLLRHLALGDNAGSISFSPDKRLLAWIEYAKGEKMGPVRFSSLVETSIAYPQALETYAGHIGFSPDGKLIAWHGANQGFGLWDVMRWQFLRWLEVDPEWQPDSYTNNVSFSSDSSLVSSFIKSGDDGSLGLWNVASGALLHSLDFYEFSSPLTFFGNGCRAFCASHEHVQIFDVATGAQLRTFISDGMSAIDGCPNGRYIATSSLSNTVRIWDGAAAPEISARVAETANLDTRGLIDFVLSPQGNLIAATFNDLTTEVWDMNSGSCVSCIETGPIGSKLYPDMMIFSPNERFLCQKGHGHWDVGVWEVGTGDQVHELDIDESWCYVVFLQDGRLAAATSGTICGCREGCDGFISKIHIWDPLSGVWETTVHDSSRWLSSQCMAVTADGTILRATSDSGFIKIWNVTAGTTMHSLKSESVSTVIFSPDQRVLASSTFYSIRFWDVASGRLLGLLDFTKFNYTEAFSPSKKLLAVSCEGNIIQLWDTFAGNMIGEYQAAYAPEFSFCKLSFSDEQTIRTEKGELDLACFRPATTVVKKNWAGPPKMLIDGPWVMQGNQRVLMLPSEYPSRYVAVHDGVIAIGLETGRIVFFGLDHAEDYS